MLISQHHKIGFIHIPKCGGSTIRQQFAAMADTDPLFSDLARLDHPLLGRVFPRHLPLWAVRDHFPESFGMLAGFRLFAICRDPYDRFESAVAEHLNFHRKQRINAFSRGQVLAISREIIDQIGAEDRLVSAKYCHFIRQSDFIFLDGERLVQNLYPIAAIPALAAELSAITSIASSAALRSNQTLDFRLTASEKPLRRISALSKRLLPIGLHARAKSLARGVLVRRGNRHRGFSRAEAEIADFIAEYYAADMALYRDLTVTP